MRCFSIYIRCRQILFDSTYTSYVEYRIVKFIVRKYTNRCQGLDQGSRGLVGGWGEGMGN